MAYIDATSLFIRTNIKVQKKNIFQWDETNKSRLPGGLQKTSTFQIKLWLKEMEADKNYNFIRAFIILL